MRVLFVSTRLSGGAGIACRRIWESFREQNRVDIATLVYRVNADLWVKQYNRASGETSTQEVYKHHSQWADEQLSKHLNEERSSFSATYLSALELEGTYDSFLTDLFDAHEIVNIHWIAGMLTIKSLQHLADTRKPVIITMHDQNYFTGACHYSAGCRLFNNLCTGCPQLQTERAQLLVEQQHRYKRAILSAPNFFWTGPSEWIVKEAARSGIPYSTNNLLPALKNPVIDDAVCEPYEVEKIKHSFQSMKPKVALVADDLNDPRKGILIGIHALTRAISNSNCAEKGIELHLVGSTDGTETMIRELIKKSKYVSPHGIGIDVVSHGRVPSHHLAVILQQVDLLIFPSIEENYSNLLIEALVAGTQIVAFGVGGNSEIAQAYPELMHIVGGRLNISNGMNGNDKPRLEHGMRLLARLIQDQLVAQRFSEHRDNATNRCKQNHSRLSIAEAYFLAMKSALETCQSIRTFLGGDSRKPSIYTEDFKRHSRRRVRQQSVNTSEPVLWLSSKNNWPLELAEGQLMFTLTLKPSWEADFISNRVDNESWSSTEMTLFTHDQYHIPELRYWDCVVLLSTSKTHDGHRTSRLLRRMDEADNGIPILLQAIVRISPSSCASWNTFSDLIWQCIVGECIVSPMQGISSYPLTVPFAQPIDASRAILHKPKPRVRQPLSSIQHHQINTEEPVYWLGRDSFNDLALGSKQSLIAYGLYPSWDTDYLSKITSDQADLQVLHEIPHTQSHLPQLRYWNTVVIRITLPSTCHLFSEEADEVHALPILYMGYGELFDIMPNNTLLSFETISKTMTTLIPAMAGLRTIVC